MTEIGPLALLRHLETRDLPIVEITGSFCRIHDARYGAIFFGRTGRYRFDAPAGEHGVLYIAEDIFGSFAETFGDTWEPRARYNTVPEAALRERAASIITLQGTLRVCDVTGAGLARIGADGRLTAADRTIGQRWSEALWRHSATVDGIRYRTRHDQSRIALALFDRAAPAVRAAPPQPLLRHAALPEVLHLYQIAVL